MSLRAVKKDLNGFTDAFYGCEKVKKIHGLVIYSYFKKQSVYSS